MDKKSRKNEAEATSSLFSFQLFRSSRRERQLALFYFFLNDLFIERNVSDRIMRCQQLHASPAAAAGRSRLASAPAASPLTPPPVSAGRRCVNIAASASAPSSPSDPLLLRVARGEGKNALEVSIAKQ